MSTSYEQNIEHTDNGIDAIDEVSSNIEKINISTDNILVCANCGKEGSDVTNTCNKCKSVMYCNAACKKKHRHKHKKVCEEHLKRAKEHAAKVHDEKLFKQPPSLFEDCPICMIRLPTLNTGRVYMNCCGKMICSGCIHAPVYDDRGNKVTEKTCPFCRTPFAASDEENLKKLEKRIELNDAHAIYIMGCYYALGRYGKTQNNAMALELWLRAVELGHSQSYNNIGHSYETGRGVEVDNKKAIHYYELSAMEGNVTARHNLGCMERQVGNMDRALKHWMIAARDGYSNSLKKVKELYTLTGKQQKMNMPKHYVLIKHT